MFTATAVAAVVLAGSLFAVRQNRIRKPRPSAGRFALTVGRGSPEGVTSPGPLSDTLSNDDIVGLSRAGLNTALIARLILQSPHRFAVDPKSLVALKRAGVQDRVIGLMIDVSLLPSFSAATGAPSQSHAGSLQQAGLPAAAPPPL